MADLPRAGGLWGAGGAGWCCKGVRAPCPWASVGFAAKREHQLLI